ncbi:MAG: hypothetical protein MZV63_54805 [Marinilabiliales bacterium]|nr:hypothetical protein [Marinilabiliales bacterium]
MPVPSIITCSSPTKYTRRLPNFHGTAVVEVIQNCVIFNDGAFDHITNKETRDDNTIVLQPRPANDIRQEP